MDKLQKNLNVFIKILKMAEEQKFPLILSGSTALGLQGVDVTVHDLDIVTDKTGALYLGALLEQYNYVPMEYSEVIEYRSYFGVYLIDGVKVDIMGEFQYRLKDGNWSLENHLHPTCDIKYEGESIQVLKLEQELIEYENRERLFVMEKIQEKLNEEV